MRNMLVLGIVAFICITGTSCETAPSTEATYRQAYCVVEPQAAVVVEIMLDGRLIASGKTAPHWENPIPFSAPCGEHIMTVTAEGHEPWERAVTVVAGVERPQGFWIRLKKK